MIKQIQGYHVKKQTSMLVHRWLLYIYKGQHEIDFSLYPDRNYQLRWLRVYLEEKAASEGIDPLTVTETDVERAYVMSNKFALVRTYRKGFFLLNVCCVMVLHTCFCVVLCVSFLYGPFCHGALKLDISTLFTTFFL